MAALERDRCVVCKAPGITAPPPDATLRACIDCDGYVCAGCDEGDLSEGGQWATRCGACGREPASRRRGSPRARRRKSGVFRSYRGAALFYAVMVTLWVVAGTLIALVARCAF